MKKITREQFDTMGPTTAWHLINALQEEQGFVPDWSKAPSWALSATTKWSGHTSSIEDEDIINIIPRPLPPKVERARTREELGNELWNLGVRIGDTFHDLKEESVKDLCLVNGVSLTVLEEV